MADTDFILDRLFRPTKSVTVGDRPLVVRALSGPEQEERSLYATHAARALEKELEQPESDVYQYRLRLLDNLDLESLIQFLRDSHAGDIRREVEKVNAPVYIPFPDEATEEERRAVLNSRDEAEVKRTDKINTAVTAQSDVYVEKNLTGKTQPELMSLAKAQSKAALLTERANMAYAHYTLYLAVSSPDGARYFTSAEDAGALNRDVIFHLYKVAQAVNEISPLPWNGRS